MNNRYIEGMKEIKADDSFKRRIINAAVHKNNYTKPSFFFKLKKSIVSVAIICAFVLVMIFLIPHVNDIRNNKNTLSENFVIKAYAADKTPFKVKPHVDFILGKYNPAMSMVPGLPLNISCSKADNIELTASEGRFLLWSPADGIVHNKGKKLKIKSGDTVYWSPYTGTDSSTATLAKSCSIILKAYKNNKELDRSIIKIKSDSDYFYTGRLTE